MKPKLNSVIKWFLLGWILENALLIILFTLFKGRYQVSWTEHIKGFLALCEIDAMYARFVWFGAIMYLVRRPHVYGPAVALVLSNFVTLGLIAMLKPGKFAVFVVGENVWDRPMFYKMASCVLVSSILLLIAKAKFAAEATSADITKRLN